MDLNNIKKRRGNMLKKVSINIKVTEAHAKWLREKNYSPTGIFLEASKELGFEEPECKEIKHLGSSPEPIKD